jgi:hypothetical protein
MEALAGRIRAAIQCANALKALWATDVKSSVSEIIEKFSSLYERIGVESGVSRLRAQQ